MEAEEKGQGVTLIDAVARSLSILLADAVVNKIRKWCPLACALKLSEITLYLQIGKIM